jgi:hypothetical protein
VFKKNKQTDERADLLGLRLTDKVTGFTGTATGFARYLTGCDQYLVLPKANDKSKYPEGQWLDVNRLTVEVGQPLNLLTDSHKGCDTVAPRY